jgi:uncharacterized protein YbjT (DUF2867 family)
MKRILVIGGTGHVGGQVLAQLPRDGVQVRAMVRRPGIEGLGPGIEMVRGDLTLPETLDACLEGVDSAFLVWMTAPGAIGPALERITKRVKRVVFLSAPIKTPHPLFQQPGPARAIPAEIERLIEEAGIEWTFLRPGMFALNAGVWWASQTRAGDVVRWPYMGVPTAPIDERDIAAVAVRALCEDGHAGAEYVLTGPESLTHAEQVATVGRAIERPLRAEEISPEVARTELLSVLGAPGVVKMLMDAWAAAEGRPALVTPTFAEVMGRPPRTFLQWATDNAAQFRVQ